MHGRSSTTSGTAETFATSAPPASSASTPNPSAPLASSSTSPAPPPFPFLYRTPSPASNAATRHSSCVGPNKEIDKTAATVLLATTKIAADSLNKAAVGAKAEAEKRVKEATITRKRAKEAMEHLASIETKEKLVKMGLGSAEFSGSGNHKSGIGNRIVTNVRERNLFGDQNRMDRVNSSSAVLAALNALELVIFLFF